MLLSIAERAGAVRACSPAAPSGLLARPTGQGSPRLAARRDPGRQEPRLGVLPLDRALHVRRRPPAAAGRSSTTSATPPPGAPSGRCCDVCDPDPELEQALTRPRRLLATAILPRARGLAPVWRSRSPRAAVVAAAWRRGRRTDPVSTARRPCPGRAGRRGRVRASAPLALRARRRQARVHGRRQHGAGGGAAPAPAPAPRRCCRSAASARRSAPSTATRCWRSWASCGGLRIGDVRGDSIGAHADVAQLVEHHSRKRPRQRRSMSRLSAIFCSFAGVSLLSHRGQPRTNAAKNYNKLR